jgi:hypothetical protein
MRQVVDRLESNRTAPYRPSAPKILIDLHLQWPFGSGQAPSPVIISRLIFFLLFQLLVYLFPFITSYFYFLFFFFPFVCLFHIKNYFMLLDKCQLGLKICSVFLKTG